MKPRTKRLWWVLSVGLIVLLALWWMVSDSAQRVVRLDDGSTVRVVGITRGMQHGYTPPFWRAWLERWGWAEPYSGMQGLFITTPEPKMFVWLQRRFPDSQSNRKLISVRLFDHKGAYLPVEAQMPELWNSREEIFGVQLPYLPADSGPVWLEFEYVPNRNSRRRLRINPPFVSRPAPTLKPQPLPARVKTPQFEAELERLEIKQKGMTHFWGSVEHHSASIIARLHIYEDGKRTNNWTATEEWLEDPYGNRYALWQAPPWHYPYWVYCAKLYPVGKARLSNREVWRSDWIQLRPRTDTLLNATTTQHGLTIGVQGVFLRANQVFEVDASDPKRYRVRPARVPLSRKLNEILPVEIISEGRARVRVRTKIPLLLFHLHLPPNGAYSYSSRPNELSDETRFVYEGYEIFVFLQDEQGRIYPAPVDFCEQYAPSTSVLAVVRLDSVPSTVRRGRVGIAVCPPQEIRLPIPPLSKEQVQKVWQWEPVRYQDTP
jgi:hypothetical protein